ncbi:MAG: hypothetical protein H6602_02040 [Flavobacteriales bacterium]|nr:hypothetical protein [Flavobacteriales bacterium]
MRTSILLLLCLNLNSCAYYFGNSWQRSYRSIPETEFPEFKANPQRISDEELVDHPLVKFWADKEVVRPTKKDQRGPERLLLAKLIAKQDVEFVNNYLLESEPWGNSGTSGALNPRGDYDFTTVVLAAILHRFKDDSTILWNRTEEHLAKNLLVEVGGKPHKKTPRTMAIMKDTENHILMTNISQYLKNQWLMENGYADAEYDNSKNGLEHFLAENLKELHITGQYEFNSKPYEGYTISALLILYSYAASGELRNLCKVVLDSWAWEYMETSSNFRKSAPFRRRMSRFSSTSLQDNASTSIMQAWWLEHVKGSFQPDEIPHNQHQALSALIYDYRPPTEIWTKDDSERLIYIGHGKGSSPEIHSRGNGFLLSAGGFQRGEASQIVARPIVLMLDDSATDLNDCFHINGKGKWQKWNNSGVHHRFAVGRQPVNVPNNYQPVDSIDNWKLFQPTKDVTVIAFSSDDFGMIYLPDSNIDLKELVQLNPEPEKGTFKTEESEFQFDLKAPRGKYVITKVNGLETDRKTDKWKRVNVVRFTD